MELRGEMVLTEGFTPHTHCPGQTQPSRRSKTEWRGAIFLAGKAAWLVISLPPGSVGVGKGRKGEAPLGSPYPFPLYWGDYMGVWC